MARYIILKDKSVSRRRRAFDEGLPAPTGTASPFDVRPTGSSTSVPPEPAVSTESMEAADLRDAARDPEVVGIARSMPTQLIAPLDSDMAAEGSGATWGIGAVGADESPEDGAGVVCCVLDTGIDRNHPAFAGMELIERDFTGSGNGDVQGHGTHCAGTVFGRDVDGLRIGVAPGVTKALIGKVLDNNGSGGSEMLFDAINWA
ncbi:MAG: S8 family serine peptidase, partial [Pseudomonadota bacterium]